MANGEHGEEVEELQGEPDTDSQALGEQDNGQGDLAQYDQHLGQLVKQGEQAGFGAQTVTLKRIRKALRNTRQQIDAAEERGRQRALAEFTNGDGQQAVTALRAEVRAELQADLSRERSLARLGIPADSPVRSLFDGVQGDHKMYERRADALRAQGISWQGDALAQQIASSRLQAAQHAAAEAQQNGQPVSLAPGNGVPAEVQELLIRGATDAMQAGQAGGQTVGADHLADDIRKMAANPGAYTEEQRLSLADRFNRDLSALSQQIGGGPL